MSFFYKERKKMKMTPEQKAFYECGKSVESVRETIQKIRQHAIHEFGEPYYLLMPSEKRILRMATDLAGKIHTVRQKRAACRAWVHPMRRRCSNCKHELTQYKCGSRMFWFDRRHPDVVFMDRREETHMLCDGRTLEIKPDVVGDFRKMPFNDGAFRLVVFDPPHLIHAGESSWLAKKYGKLDQKTWREDLKSGFRECFRVLEPGGILVFKWCEDQVSTAEVLKLASHEPLFGHRRGKTVFLVFMKSTNPN